MKGELKILILEDVPEDVDLIKFQFDDFEQDLEFATCFTKSEYLQLLHSFKPDVILSDFNMPSFDGLEALQLYRQNERLEPFIFVTGSLGEENAVASIKAGATDFITKDKIDQLPVAIIKALREAKTKRQNLAYEAQIKAINTFNAALVKNKEWQAALKDSLEVICRTLSIDRGFYFSVNDKHHRIADLQIDWGTSGNGNRHRGPLSFQNLPLDTVPEILEPLLAGQPVSFVVRKMKNEAAKIMLRNEGILSILIMPLHDGQQLNGILGLADCFKERHWVDEEIQFLQTLGRDLNSAFEKRKAQKALLASEERFRSLVQNGSELITILSAKYHVQFASENYNHILKYPASYLIELPLKKLVHPDDWPTVEEALEALHRNNYTEVDGFRLKAKDGTFIWVHAKFSNMLMVPSVRGIVVNMIEVSNLKQKEQELELSQTRYKYASMASEDLVFDWDLKTNKVHRVRSFNSLLPKELEENGDTIEAWSNMMHPKDRDKVFADLKEKLAQPDAKLIDQEYRIIDSNGGLQYVHDKGYVVRDERGKALRLVGATSITTAKRKAVLKSHLMQLVHESLAREDRLNICLQKMLKGIVEQTRMRGGEVWLSDPDETELQMVAEYNTRKKLSDKDKINRFVKSVGLPGKVLQEKRSLLLSDLSNSDVFERKKAAKNTDTQSATAVPIRFESKILGAILLFSQYKGEELAFYQNLLDEISTQVGTEVKRKMSESMLEMFFKVSPDFMLIYNFQGEVRKVNRAVCDITGYNEQEIIGRPILDFAPPEERERLESRHKELISLDDESVGWGQIQTYIISKAGEKRWIAWNTAIVKEEKMIYAVARDITDRVENLAEIKRQNSKLREIAWIQSHEVRAPLARFLALLNLLEIEGGEHSPEERELLNFMRLSGEELDGIIARINDKTQNL